MSQPKEQKLITWLLENGGPVVRWRTASELVEEMPQPELDRLASEALAAPEVLAWLERLSLGDLESRLDALDEQLLGRLGGRIHGSKDTCLENVLGKLSEFGLKGGMPGEAGQRLDKMMNSLAPIYRWNGEWKQDVLYRNTWETLSKSVFAWGLLRLGHSPDAAMQAFLLEHLDTCHKIARDQVYDIYADESELVGLPKAWVGKPIIKQAVMANYWLPYIHDLYVFSHLAKVIPLRGDDLRKVDELVRYILDPRFQALREGYGYAWIKERRTCYGWGWSPHLPAYQGFDFATPHQANGLVQRIELMAHFPAARASAWFQNCLVHLEGFRTERGTYCFPSNILIEREGYYVSGSHMGLGESPRNQSVREVESTFRMLRIKCLNRS